MADHVLFTLFVQWCPTHIVLCFCFDFLRIVYPMLPVFLDFPFFDHLDKSAPRHIGTYEDISAPGQIDTGLNLMYFHVYSTFSKK
jgi:hypothetical protein